MDSKALGDETKIAKSIVQTVQIVQNVQAVLFGHGPAAGI
jgi:hypothetical protein